MAQFQCRLINKLQQVSNICELDRPKPPAHPNKRLILAATHVTESRACESHNHNQHDTVLEVAIYTLRIWDRMLQTQSIVNLVM